MIRDEPTPATAKKIARRVVLRSDWEQVKDGIMLTLLREKFSQEPERAILLKTGSGLLIEGNWWHDNYWGDCSCSRCASIDGENKLGKLLMQVRSQLEIGQLKAESESYEPTEG